MNNELHFSMGKSTLESIKHRKKRYYGVVVLGTLYGLAGIGVCGYFTYDKLSSNSQLMYEYVDARDEFNESFDNFMYAQYGGSYPSSISTYLFEKETAWELINYWNNSTYTTPSIGEIPSLDMSNIRTYILYWNNLKVSTIQNYLKLGLSLGTGITGSFKDSAKGYANTCLNQVGIIGEKINNLNKVKNDQIRQGMFSYSSDYYAGVDLGILIPVVAGVGGAAMLALAYWSYTKVKKYENEYQALRTKLNNEWAKQQQNKVVSDNNSN